MTDPANPYSYVQTQTMVEQGRFVNSPPASHKPKFRKLIYAILALVVFPLLAVYTYGHVQNYKRLWKEHDLAYRYLSDPIAKTDQNAPMDRAGLINFIITDYFKRLEREAKEGIPAASSVEKDK